MLKIDKTIKAEIEATINQTIPDPQSLEFEPFFERLMREHPELARRLEDAIEVTEPYPDEEAQQAVKRREGIAAFVRWLFFHEVWGRWVLNRRALSIAIFCLAFGAVATSWSVMLLRQPRAEAESALATSQTETAPMNDSVTPTQTDSADTGSPETSLLVVPETQVDESRSQTNIEQPQPASQTSTSNTDAPPRTLESTSAGPSPSSSNSPQPTTPSIDSLSQSQASAASQGSALAFGSSSDTPQQSAVLAFENSGEQASQSAALAFAEPPRGEPTSAAITEDEPQPSATSASSSSEPVLNPSVNPPSEQSAMLEPQVNGSPSRSSAEVVEGKNQLRNSAPNARATATLEPSLLETEMLEPDTAADLLRPGTLLPATLQKDILLAEGETKQVIADSSGAWCEQDACPRLRWVGTVTLTASGRLDVQLTQAIVGEEVFVVQGVAYGMDNAEGLPAHIADTTPTLLADLLRAGAGGVTDYAEARAEQGSVTIGEGRTTIETDAPGLLESVLGRAAGTVQIPDDQTGVIRIAAAERGAKLEVLVLQ